MTAATAKAPPASRSDRTDGLAVRISTNLYGIRLAFATAAVILGAGAAAGPVIYQSDLVLQVRLPVDAELARAPLDAATAEAAVELSGTHLVARARRDLARSAANRLLPAQAFDGLLAAWPVREVVTLPLGVEVRTVGGTGRLLLTRWSFNPVRAALVLNILADEFVRMRFDRVGEQEARLGAALLQVDDQLRANASTYEQLMIRDGVGDRDLLVAAAVPANSQLLATRYDAVAYGPAGESKSPARQPRDDAQNRGSAYGEQVLQALAGLRLRRDDLAARYITGSPPLRDFEATIAILKAAQKEAEARRVGGPARQPMTSTAPPRQPAGPTPEDGRVASSDRARAALGHRCTAAQQLTWRAEQLGRQRDLLRRNAEDLASVLGKMRLRRLTGTSGGADVEVIETARVPADGIDLRGGLLFAALASAVRAALVRSRSASEIDRR